MLDINNVELNIGDKVVYTYASSGFLFIGEIVKFTKLGLEIRTELPVYAYSRVTHPTNYKITNLMGAEKRVMKLA